MEDFNISKNFKYSEMVKSGYAEKYNKDNSPNAVERSNIYRLVTEVLQPIRDEFGEPVVVTSCFRSEEVNRGVGGVKNSDHRYGAAADIRTKSDLLNENMKLWNCIIKMKNEGRLNCRQIIFEYGRRSVGPSWIHVSINHDKNTFKDNEVIYIN